MQFLISASLLEAAIDEILQLGRTKNSDKTELIITWRLLPLDFTRSGLKVALVVHFEQSLGKTLKETSAWSHAGKYSRCRSLPNDVSPASAFRDDKKCN